MSTDTRKFTPEMTVGQALAIHPDAGMIFSSYHLGGCSHCAISEDEVLSDICMSYGIPLEDFMADLNSLNR
jgi:hybrid cluster-associated redox disulfide protein